ncbi:MAG TPA: hypothetical protein VJ485_02505 [archaeon]|nr:hypothetical protein [archaeon]
MAKKSVPADEAEFRKSFRKAKKKLEGIRKEIRRRRNKNPLWKF